MWLVLSWVGCVTSAAATDAFHHGSHRASSGGAQTLLPPLLACALGCYARARYRVDAHVSSHSQSGLLSANININKGSRRKKHDYDDNNNNNTSDNNNNKRTNSRSQVRSLRARVTKLGKPIKSKTSSSQT